MVNDSNLKKASVHDVLKAFWRGVKPQEWAFYVSIFSFIGVQILGVIAPLFYKRFFDSITAGGDKTVLAPQLIHILVIVLVLHGASWFLFRIGLFILNMFEAGVMARLKQMSFDHLIEHSYTFFSNNFTGSLVQRISRFSRAFEKLYDTLVFTFLPLFINIVGILIVMWYQEPTIAVIILVWVLATTTCNYLFSTWKVKYDLRAAAADSATTGFLADTITNQNTVASFTGTQYESQAFRKISGDQSRAMRLSWDLSSLFDGVQAALIFVVEFLIFYYAVQFWQQGIITVGTFVLIQVYILGLAQRLWDFSRIVRNVYEGFADSEEMVSILSLPHEVKDGPDAHSLTVKKGRVRFENVSFRFNESSTVLQNINLDIRGGEKIALIGPSGAGKSTLARLILRMYNLKEGSITIDEEDVQEVTQESLRHNISFVPQDPVLFHRSLLENIRYGRRDASDNEVIKAAKLAHCDEFIVLLPNKYETLVGERGIKLSGGERQRVAIARAILKNAPILILDEATSSLDSHSEALIQDALDKLMKGKTTIVIAHRLSTIRKMDRIIVIQNGKIVEEGTHHDLVARDKSLYKYLWNLQAGGFIKG